MKLHRTCTFSISFYFDTRIIRIVLGESKFYIYRLIYSLQRLLYYIANIVNYSFVKNQGAMYDIYLPEGRFIRYIGLQDSR